MTISNAASTRIILVALAVGIAALAGPAAIPTARAKRIILVDAGFEIVIEAMKMEHTIHAPMDGNVTAVFFAEGDLVEEGVELLTIDAAEGR